MPATSFVPTGLNVLPDGTLSRTLFEYRHALRLLTASAGPRPARRGMRRTATDTAAGQVQAVARSMQEAVAALEAEMQARRRPEEG